MSLTIVLCPDTPEILRPTDIVRGMVVLDIVHDTLVKVLQIHFQGFVHTKVPGEKREEEHAFFSSSVHLIDICDNTRRFTDTSGNKGILLQSGHHTFDFYFQFPEHTVMDCEATVISNSSYSLRHGHVYGPLPSTVNISDTECTGRVTYELLAHLNGALVDIITRQSHDDISTSVFRELDFQNTTPVIETSLEDKPQWAKSEEIIFRRKKIKQSTPPQPFIRRLLTRDSMRESLNVRIELSHPSMTVTSGKVPQGLELFLTTHIPPEFFMISTESGPRSNKYGKLTIDSIEALLIEGTHYRAHDTTKNKKKVFSLLKKATWQVVDLMNASKLYNTSKGSSEALYGLRLPDSLLSSIMSLPSDCTGSLLLCNLEREYRLAVYLGIRADRHSTTVLTGVELPVNINTER